MSRIKLVRSAPLPRRTLLRGALHGAGVALGLPALGAMLNQNGTALAQGDPLPRRFGLFFWGNGMRPKQWIPADTGPSWTPSEELAPLATVKPYVSVVTGTALRTGNQYAHHAGTAGALSGAALISQTPNGTAFHSTFSQPSMDQVVATAFANTTPFRSIETAISRRIYSREGTGLQYVSHNGPDDVNPPEFDPAKLFARLFTTDGGGAGAAALEKARAVRRSVLDAVGAEITGLSGRLGVEDRRRLEQHLDNVRTLEKRLQSAPSYTGAACKPAPVPARSADTDGREPLEDVMKAMSDVLALAWACDLSRVFSMQFSCSVGSTVFWQVGSTRGSHDLTHNEPGEQPEVNRHVIFIMQQLAYLLQRLRATPDGAGNLLDQSAIVATSDCSDGRAHALSEYPLVIAGRAGGALVHPGVHHRVEGGDNFNKPILSVLRAVGVRLAQYGKGGGAVTSGLSAIEA